MNGKRGWMVLWAVISVMWVFYWFIITSATGGENVRDMVASLDGEILLTALILSLPMAAYSLGMLAAWLVKLAKGNDA